MRRPPAGGIYGPIPAGMHGLAAGPANHLVIHRGRLLGLRRHDKKAGNMTGLRLGRADLASAGSVAGFLMATALVTVLVAPIGIARAAISAESSAISAESGQLVSGNGLEGSARISGESLTTGSQSLASPMTSNEAGDIVEVRAAHASPAELGAESWIVNCHSEKVPFLGAVYDPCGEVYLYDAKRESSTEVPTTNEEEDKEWDACGTLVSSGATANWRITGKEYLSSGWIPGHVARIPFNEPTSCLGTWKLMYKFTETFSDGSKLSASIEVPFTVTAVPTPASATWGGGNPSELPCSQVCNADPVNTATGDYSESTTDLAIHGRGPGLQMNRTYSSRAAQFNVSSALGRGWAFSYGMSLKTNAEGQLVITNANGSRTVFVPKETGGYEAPSRVLATLVKSSGTYTYAVKARTIYTFNSSGQLTSIGDLNGNKTTLAYNVSGRLESATDSAGRKLTFSYNESGKLAKVTDSSGRSVSYGYDASGRLNDATDVRGGHTRYTYTEAGYLGTREDARGNVVLTNTYDAYGRVRTQEDALKAKTSYTYSEAGSTTTTDVTDPRGYVTEYEYADFSLAKRIEAKGTESSATWTYEHDPSTRGITAVTDPNGHTTHATYDSRGNQTSTEDAPGHKTKSVYDSLDDLTEYTDAKGVKTTNKYDEKGNLLSSSTPLIGSEPAQSRTFTYAYESKEHSGDITSITDPNGKTTTFTYDAAGDLASVTDATSDKTTYAYDALGRRLTQVSPRGNAKGGKPSEYTTTFAYDAAGNRVTATDPLGHERKWSYDADGNVETETDANGHTTSVSYDAANRLLTVKRPNGLTERTAYDADGNVESQANGLERATSYTYNPLDRLASSIDPLGRTTSYVYDGAGNLTSKTDPDGRTTTYSYNVGNELTKLSYSDGITPTVEYGYDADGHRTSMSDGTGSSSFSFDSLGRLTSATDGHGDKTSYGYDLAGNETSITYPNGKNVTHTFDNAGRLASVSDWLGNTTSFSYDPDSNLLSNTFPSSTGNVDEYVYSRADRMSEVKMKKSKETLASIAYVRDKAGQLESLTSKGLPGAESEGFGYDVNNRLIKAGGASYEYDAANDLTKAPGTINSYDNASELEAGTNASYTYDKEGDRIRSAPALSEAPAYDLSFGSPGSEAGQLSSPSGIATDKAGNTWVSDTGNNRIQEFNSKGEFVRQFGGSGSAPGQFAEPRGIAIDSSGDVWVVDSNNHRVQEFGSKGEFIRQLGTEGEGEGQFGKLQSIAIGPEGNVWTVEGAPSIGKTRIQEFTAEGTYLNQFGAEGSSNAQFLEPQGIALDRSGNVWIADTGNNRIQELRASGEFIRAFGSEGTENGKFKRPGGLAIDPEGTLWVADTANSRVQRFSAAGAYLSQFGIAGSGTGQFSEPKALAVGSEGDVWIADTGNSRVEDWLLLTTIYTYDQAGNLTAVQRREFGKTPAINETYAYDGAGLRASQAIAGAKSYLTWDESGGLPLLLNDGQTNYIYGPGGLPAEQISSEVVTYYHHDQLGSTRMLTTGSGSATGMFTYGAFGALISSSGTQATPLGYAGQYTNSQSGLIYLRARVYDPATGQFLTRDPQNTITRQPYAYAFDNPLNMSDPNGRDASTEIAGAADTVCGLTVEIPFVGEATCAGAGVATAAAAALALHHVLASSDSSEGEAAGEDEQCPWKPGDEITFGHGERHLEGTGLTPEEVESAIEEQVRQGTEGADVNGPFRGRVRVGGREIEYRGYGRDGEIHVGTYYPVD